MAQPAYIRIEGVTQGLISSGASTEASIGNRYQSGHEDEIMAQEISHIVTVPTDLKVDNQVVKECINLLFSLAL